MVMVEVVLKRVFCRGVVVMVGRGGGAPWKGLRRALDTITETRDEVHLSPSYHNQPYRLDDSSGKPHERKSKILKLGVVA